MSDTDPPATDPDLPPEVRVFLLRYPQIVRSIDRSKATALKSMQRVYARIATAVRQCSWYSASSFAVESGSAHCRVWKNHWVPEVTIGCPWVNFVFFLRWEECRIEARLQLDSRKVIPPEARQSFANALNQKIDPAPPQWFTGQGWQRHVPLKRGSVFLECQEDCNDASLCTERLVAAAINHFDQLSALIAPIDETIKQMFPDETTGAS